MTLACHSYKLPLVKALQTSQQTFEDRKGFILSLLTENEGLLYGEIAPLPGFSNETYESVQKILVTHKNTIEKIINSSEPVGELQKFYRDANIPPSVQFGLDTLAYQLQAQNNDQSLFSYLFPEANPTIAVNTLVSLQGQQLLERVDHKITSGFKTIKCKVGLHVEQELEFLQTIRSKYPTLRIRVDANQAWNLDEAIEYCNRLYKLDIEYCEEPLAEITPSNLEHLSQNTALPLALDETTVQHSYWPNLLPFTEYLIIKPMITGSFQKNIETKRLANTHNNRVVVTTSLESGVGRYFTSLIAAGLGSPKTAHGLSTGNLLANDIIFSEINTISKGSIELSSQALPTINFDKQYFTKLF